MNLLSKFLSRRVKLYDRGGKQEKPIQLGSRKLAKKTSFENLPQYEQQRRALGRIYKGKDENFGWGVGP